MTESVERINERIQEGVEKVETLEEQMQEINNSLEQIEQALGRLEGKGDQMIADSVKRNLADRQQEKTQKEQEARQVMQELDQVRVQILEVDSWNTEAHQEIRMLEQLGENVGDAANRIADRERAVEEMESREQDAQNRLRHIAQSSGFA